MTGLNLETFLRLLRADAGVWGTLGLVLGILAVMTWTSWGSRKALRKCLMLSILAHAGAIYYGKAHPQFFLPGDHPAREPRPAEPPRIREIEVRSANGPTQAERSRGQADPATSLLQAPDPGASALLSSVEPETRPDRPEATATEAARDPGQLTELLPEATTPNVAPETPNAVEERPAPPEPPTELARTEPDESAVPLPDRSPAPPAESPATGRPDRSVRPARPSTTIAGRSASTRGTASLPSPTLSAPNVSPRETIRSMNPADPAASPEPSGDADAVASAERPGRPDALAPAPARPEVGPLRLDRATSTNTGRSPSRETDRPALAMNPADLRRLGPGVPDSLTPGPRAPGDVPTVYRPRLDPNRAARARQAGASDASEQAVERALAWLARHQDDDGRWNAGTARYGDGTAATGDVSFTSHCPPGDVCHGECYYWEADTAVTGLALLTFLGAGYTHQDGGKYAPTIRKGLDYLLKEQKADGDLRGKSRAVGMYCHTMAALAVSEAYALTGDARLQSPVDRAVDFVVKAQYPGLMGWRYSPNSEITEKTAADGKTRQFSPHPRTGDTSVLGWVVLLLKSGHEVGAVIPSSASKSALGWLDRVADGPRGGLARYQPSRPADPTMTAEAWVCRQFLGLEDRGPSSDEAMAYLLANPPSSDQFNIYYCYYGTLAMYQRGGDGWERWNSIVRDQLVGLQRTDGHKAGSWDPDSTRYGTHGGRLYTTALSTLTLEVYYRYLRLYDGQTKPSVPGVLATPPRADDLQRTDGSR